MTSKERSPITRASDAFVRKFNREPSSMSDAAWLNGYVEAVSSSVETKVLVASDALRRIAFMVRTNWGDDVLQSISKVLDEALPGWLERGSPEETSESYHGIGCAKHHGGECNCAASEKASVEPAVLDRIVTVCDKCLCACCWHGEFMCDEAKSAGTVDKSIRDLLAIGEPRESNEYWFKSPANGKIDQAGLHALRAYLAEKGTQGKS